MRASSLSVLVLLGFAHALPPVLRLTHENTPLTAWMVDPNLGKCTLAKPPQKLSTFRKLFKTRRLYRPCRYMMKRTSRGILADYHSEVDKKSKEYLQFVFNIPHWEGEGTSTYITSIGFEQDGIGSNCTAARFSDTSPNPIIEPQYSTWLQAVSDHTPRWNISHNHLIDNAAPFLLEVPWKCLDRPTALTIETLYNYEDSGRQLLQMRGTGEFFPLSPECRAPYTQIYSIADYRLLAIFRSSGCRYRFERDYSWIVPASHVYVGKSNETVVVGQLALPEGMASDTRRHLTEVRLGELRGASCAETTSAWALQKQPSVKKYRKRTRSIAKQELVNGKWRVRLEGEMQDDRFYNVKFKIYPGCELINPVMELRYVDTNTDLDPEE